MRATKLIVVACWSAAMAGAASAGYAQTPAVQTFTLHEYLGVAWQHELVFFPLTPALRSERANLTLLGPDGAEVPYQLVGEDQAPRLAFLADLAAGAESSYRLVRRPPQPGPSPLLIQRRTASLRLSNGVTGVEVPTAAGAYRDGPLLGVRMKSGRWIGGSRLTLGPAIEQYEVSLLAEGPVYAEVECRYRFAGGKRWTVRMRVLSGEPVVLINESADLGDASRWDLRLDPNFSPDHVLCRPTEGGGPAWKGALLQNSVFRIQPELDPNPVTLCAWVGWWGKTNVQAFGLFRTPAGETYVRDADQQRMVRALLPGQAAGNEGAFAPLTGADDDMLVVAAGRGEAWAREGENGQQKYAPLQATPDGQLALQLSLAGPGRYWMLGAVSVAESIVPDKQTPLPHALMNKYCVTSLDEVKDMTLSWPRAPGQSFPRLLLTRDEVLKRVAEPGFEERLRKYSTPQTMEFKRLCMRAIAGRSTAEDRPALEAMKQQIFAKLQTALGWFLPGNNGYPTPAYGLLATRFDVGYVIAPIDLALGAGVFTPPEEDLIRARLAFLAYKVSSPNYCSPPRNYQANPSMQTSTSVSTALLGCLLSDHPLAATWTRDGRAATESMLEGWQGSSGAWLEAPHYQMVAMDTILYMNWATANAGMTKSHYDPRLARAILFLGKLSTPPDPRFNHLRHYPPLGNTYLMETSALFGMMAYTAREADPAVADQLQWTWAQQGKPYWLGLGGDYMLDVWREFLVDCTPNPPAPKWTSEQLPGFGAVLRSGFPGDRETYLVYHQGEVSAAHYDDDQGSFEMWGKGRPLCLDWGYHGYAPAWQHSRVDIGSAGRVTAFASTAAADYVHGQQQGGWDRQLLFVKDRDPLGPNYFLLCDSTTAAPDPMNWWLWVYSAASPTVAGDVVHARGTDDVDLDLWVAPPANALLPALQPQELTIATVTGYVGGSWSSWDEGKTTQYGLKLTQTRGTPVRVLLYPRLRNEAAPVFTALAGGKGVKVVSPAGVDYVFLALEPFEFTEGPVSFSGTAGVLQVRGEKVTCSLSAAGEIAYGQAHLAAPGPESRTFGEQ